MSDTQWPSGMVRLGLLSVVAVAVLVAGILLARNTTGHDWYSAGKLTLHQAMLTMGFSEHKAVAYRTSHGDTWNIIRVVLVGHGPLIRARRRILTTIWEGLMLGAGAGGTVFCLMLLGAAGHWRRGGRTVATVEPASGVYPYRPPPAWGGAGRARGWFRPRSRAGLVVIPVAEIEDVERFVAHGESPRPVTAVEPGADAVEHPPALPAAGPGDGAEIESTREKDAAKPAPGGAGKQASRPRRGRGTLKSDGKTSARRQTHLRRKPDGDGDFF
ncbi:MAG: hypothetical protein OXU42_03215 [Deltaproteobacteria bacterium]|nr:hypothetical protein [Deltaproteobacteria bacterium]